MENQRKLDKLSKLAGLLLDNTLTPNQAKQLVELLVNLNTKQKEDMVKTFGEMSDSFTQEAYSKLQEAVSMVSQKHSDALLEVRQLTNKQRKEHEARLEELQSLLVEIKSVKVENGKDADEELIVEKVLERIEIPEYKETILDDGKQIADKLNILEEVIDQKVIKGLTKKITDLSSNIAHNVIKGSSTTLVNGKLAKNINFSGSASVSYNGDNANVTITGGGGGAVDSVNGQTGIVVLDTGDIAEATDLNYVSDAQLTVIGNTSGTNTGDVTLAGEDYLSIVGQAITANAIDLDNLSATGTPDNTKFLRGDNTWATPAGSGDVSKVGTPVNTQVGYWTGDGTLAGDAGLTYNATTNVLTATGFVGALTGNADTVTTNANLTGVVTSTGNATAIADNALSIAKTSGLQTALDGKLASSFTKAQLDTAVSDGNVLFVGDITQYTDELAQDAVGGIVANSTFINLAYNDGAPSVTASLSATGTPDNTTYLRGDNTWATISSSGQTLYEAIVATSGGDYTTLGAAITAGKTRIFVRNGTYSESAISTSTADISIIGESPLAVLSFGTASCTFSGARINIQNISFVNTTAGVVTFSGANARIFNCKFSGTATTTTQLVFSGAYSIVEMCTFGTYGDGAGDKVTVGGDRMQIRNCTINHGTIGNSSSYGFFALTANRSTISGCTGTLALSSNDCLFRIAGGDQMIITGNNILIDGGKFIGITNTNSSVMISNNYSNPIGFISHNSSASTQGMVCTGNNMQINGIAGAYFTKLLSSGTFNYCNFSDNVISFNASVTTAIQLGGTNNIVSNNIMKDNAPTTALVMASGSNNNIITGNQFMGSTVTDSGTGNVSANNI